MTKLLIIFIVLNVVNVILQTMKSIATVKCGKCAAAAVNAIAYGLYTVVIIYTNCDLSLWAKVIVVAATNLIGVYVVKWLEQKLRKDKLWKIECTFPRKFAPYVNSCNITHNSINVDSEHTVFNFYCVTPKESRTVKNLIDRYHGKYFASETKLLS